MTEDTVREMWDEIQAAFASSELSDGALVADCALLVGESEDQEIMDEMREAGVICTYLIDPSPFILISPGERDEDFVRMMLTGMFSFHVTSFINRVPLLAEISSAMIGKDVSAMLMTAIGIPYDGLNGNFLGEGRRHFDSLVVTAVCLRKFLPDDAEKAVMDSLLSRDDTSPGYAKSALLREVLRAIGMWPVIGE